VNQPLHSDALLEHMESLLRAWRPGVTNSEPPTEIPELTDALQDSEETRFASVAPIPSGISREVLQAQLAVAAEQVMRDLYRTLSTDLNDRISARVNKAVTNAVEQTLAETVVGLRRSILVSVAEALTESIEHLGEAETTLPEESPLLSRSSKNSKK